MQAAARGAGAAMLLRQSAAAEALVLALKRAAASEGGACSSMYTLAKLEAASAHTLQRLNALGHSLQADLSDLQQRIPLLVRSIWGGHSEAVVAALRQRQAAAARRLIASWEEAEHRLVAVANSLASQHSGQRLVAVGVPLAAAQLWPRTAHAYHAPAAPALRPAGARGELSLGQLGAAVARAAAALREELAILLRGLFLFTLFLPAIVTAPACLLGDAHRARWLELLRWTLEQAGPAFIKWGQWAATRPDLFPADACDALAALQTRAPTHAYAHTAAAIQAAFGAPVSELFSEFEAEPVASGSIAQVYRATLSPRGAALAAVGDYGAAGGLLPLRRRRAAFGPGTTVAVKVRHPGVTSLMERDFALMRRGAALLAALPLVGSPAAKESVMQFGAPLREQLDLSREAAHLAAFSRNFRHWWGVAFPRPAGAGLVSPDVLVESFEEGELISQYTAREGRYNRQLADLGLHCYLKMLLADNLIHADMHPGNILVRLEQPAPGGLAARLASLLSLELRLPRLVLLDVGMTAALDPADQHNLVGFFKSLTSMDGATLADSIMTFAEAPARDAPGFRRDMAALFDRLDPELLRTSTPDVVAAMMDMIRQHGVHLKGVVSTVVITTMVLEGWSSKLNPDIRIMDTLRDLLPTSRAARLGKALDRSLSSGSLALAAI